MGKFKTKAIVAESWISLGERRNALRVLFYEELITVDRSIQFLISAQDAEINSGKLLEMVNALASGALDEDELVLLGYKIFQRGFSPGRVMQFTDVLLRTIKAIYVWDWMPEIEEAWKDVLGRASNIVQNSTRRHHFASVK